MKKHICATFVLYIAANIGALEIDIDIHNSWNDVSIAADCARNTGTIIDIARNTQVTIPLSINGECRIYAIEKTPGPKPRQAVLCLHPNGWEIPNCTGFHGDCSEGSCTNTGFKFVRSGNSPQHFSKRFWGQKNYLNYGLVQAD